MDEFVSSYQQQTPTPATKKMNLPVLIVAVIIVGIILVIAWFKFFSSSAVSPEFINQYQMIDATTKEIVGSYGFNFAQLSSYAQSHDVDHALPLIADGLSQNIQNTTRMTRLRSQTIALKSKRFDTSNQDLGDKISKLYNLLDQRNSHIDSYLSNQTKVLTSLKAFYESAGAGKITINIDQLLSSMQEDINTINGLNFQIDATYQDIIKIAGISDNQQTNGALIQSQLQSTPEVKPTVQYSIPTAIPTPTIVVEPTASPSATPTVAASPTATSSAH